MIVHAHVLHLAHLDCRKRSRNENQDPSLVSLISYHRADFHIRIRLAASCSDFPITTTKVLSKRQYRKRPCMQTLHQHIAPRSPLSVSTTERASLYSINTTTTSPGVIHFHERVFNARLHFYERLFRDSRTFMSEFQAPGFDHHTC